MILKDLCECGAITENDLSVFHIGCRDNKDAIFYIDKKTHAIVYLDDYVGDQVYVEGSHRDNLKSIIGDAEFERKRDNLRRKIDLKPYYSNKKILDFGCGKGDFLKLINNECEAYGYELDKLCLGALKDDGLNVFDTMDNFGCDKFQSIFMFHVLEHIPSQIDTLLFLRSRLEDHGSLIIEVPHGLDSMLHINHLPQFKNFSLWTQHLVLHTENSLQHLIEYCGLKLEHVYYLQRYDLANHYKWLSSGKPGGHKDPSLKFINHPHVNNQYTEYLKKQKATDTLLVVASKP